jgi:hypothetical protein
MKGWLRRLRGVLGIGTLWGLPAVFVGAVGGGAASVFGGAPLLGAIVTGTTVVGGLFFALGTVFAAALTMLEGRRTLEELSPRRAASWGALAGAVLPVVGLVVSAGPEIVPLLLDRQLLLTLLSGVGSYAALAAALAGGTVALARQAPPELSPGPLAGASEMLTGPKDG